MVLRKAQEHTALAFILGGMTLRLLTQVHSPLHQDEALYGYWGRLISSGRVPLLATVAVDKPPLFPYLVAASEAAFGVSEFAVRLPGLAASLLCIALTCALASHLYSDRVTGIVAAGVIAFTPYPVLFGATAFTDPVLLVGWLAACFAVVRDRYGCAGCLLGLSFAAKQQAVVLAPLVFGLGLLRWQRQGYQNRWQAGARFLLGFASVLGLVFLWDGIRVANGAGSGFWGQGVDSFGGLRLIRSTELMARLRDWYGLGRYVLGWAVLGLLFFLGMLALLAYDVMRGRQKHAALADLTLIAFVFSYLFFHLLLAFPVWDRYVLPLVTVVGVLLGRMTALILCVARRMRPQRTSLVLQVAVWAIVTAALVSGALSVTTDEILVRADQDAYAGLQRVLEFLRALPVGTVLYDRWLSWHYDFYLFDAYLYRAGFPSPTWMAQDAVAFYDGRPRFLVVPSWERSARLERALGEVGLAMTSVLTTHRRDGTVSFTVYAITSGE